MSVSSLDSGKKIVPHTSLLNLRGQKTEGAQTGSKLFAA